jgi:hypothetical protein
VRKLTDVMRRDAPNLAMIVAGRCCRPSKGAVPMAETDPGLKRYVLDALAKYANLRFDFVLKNPDPVRVHTGALPAVAAAIGLNWIRVRPLSEYKNAGAAAAAYAGIADIMHIDTNVAYARGPANVFAEGEVVHEAVHAFFDIYNHSQKLTQASSEAAAYIVQAVFMNDAGCQLPAKIGTYFDIFSAANGLTGQARSGAVLERKDINALRNAVIADYKRRFTYDPDKVLSLGLRTHPGS